MQKSPCDYYVCFSIKLQIYIPVQHRRSIDKIGEDEVQSTSSEKRKFNLQKTTKIGSAGVTR